MKHFQRWVFITIFVQASALNASSITVVSEQSQSEETSYSSPQELFHWKNVGESKLTFFFSPSTPHASTLRRVITLALTAP